MHRSPDEPVELLVGERVIAKGEVVIVGGTARRITELMHEARSAGPLEAEMNWWPIAVTGSVLVAVLFDIGVLVWLSQRPRRTDAPRAAPRAIDDGAEPVDGHDRGRHDGDHDRAEADASQRNGVGGRSRKHLRPRDPVTAGHRAS
jgi:hypothetical protein